MSEEDLLQEDIGNSRRRHRPNRHIDQTQYDEDSDYDEESKEEKPNTIENDKEDENDDSDIFASDGEQTDDKAENTDKQNKDPLLIELDDFNRENEIDTSRKEFLDESANSDDDDEDNSKGPKIEAFNIDNEVKEGAFNQNATPGSKEDEDDVMEWMDLKKNDIKKAKAAQEHRMMDEKRRKSLRQIKSTEQLLFELITFLKPVESPMEALGRLNKTKPKQRKRVKVQKTGEEIKREQDVMILTDCCESLIEKGVKDIYYLEREELMLQYKQESGKNYQKPQNEGTTTQNALGNGQSIPSNAPSWEFRWIGDSTVHGPHSTHEMIYWKDNYFQGKVEARKVGTEGFKQIDEVSFL